MNVSTIPNIEAVVENMRATAKYLGRRDGCQLMSLFLLKDADSLEQAFATIDGRQDDLAA